MLTAITIAKSIRFHRERLGWSMKDAANHSGMKQPNWARLESGSHYPSVRTLEVVAHTLGVHVVDLFKEQEAPLFDNTSNPES